MPRVKRGTKARRRHKKILKLAKGNVGGRRKQYRQARETVEKGPHLRLSRPPGAQARVPRPVDRAHQRRRAFERAELQPAHARPEARRHRHGSQDPRRPRRARSGRLPAVRRSRQGAARRLTRHRRASPVDGLSALSCVSRAARDGADCCDRPSMKATLEQIRHDALAALAQCVDRSRGRAAARALPRPQGRAHHRGAWPARRRSPLSARPSVRSSTRSRTRSSARIDDALTALRAASPRPRAGE